MRSPPTLLLLALLAASAAGCVAPATDVAPGGVTPPAPASWAKAIPATLGGLEPLANAVDVASGAGIWMDGDFAFVSGLSSGAWFLNVSTPGEPRVVGHLETLRGSEERLFTRDADVAWVDGRRIVAFAGQGQGMHFVDATDPTNPRLLTTLDLKPNHNLAVFPGKPYVLNSASTGQGGKIDVVDISNPDDPKVVLSFGEYGCHDITFHVTPAKSRLYCAGVDLTEIWDVADPLNPVLVTRIENDAAKSYGLGLHHSAYATHNGTLLIIGDETFGGGGPGCGATTPAGTTPIGSLWFYDVTDEKSPKLLSNVAPNAPVDEYAANAARARPDPANPFSAFGAVFGLSCTSHFGDFVPGHDALVWGFYRAGVLLIDFSDPSNPVIRDQWTEGSNVWDVKVHNGYLFTGDIFRGLDVLDLVAG